MTLEIVEALSPHLSIRLEPVVKLDERLETEAVKPSLSVRSHDDESGIAQDAQVLGDSRLAEPQPSYEVSHWQLFPEQQIKDPASARLCDHIHRRVDNHRVSIPPRLYACQGI